MSGFVISHLCGKLKSQSVTVSKRNDPTFPASSSGRPLRVFRLFLVSHYNDWRPDQSPCPWDHYPVILILVLLPDGVLPTDARNSSLLFGCVITPCKVIWSGRRVFVANVVVQIFGKKSLRAALCNIQMNMQPYFGNSRCRDVRGGYDWWDFYSESVLKCTPVIHLFMASSIKRTRYSTTIFLLC